MNVKYLEKNAAVTKMRSKDEKRHNFKYVSLFFFSQIMVQFSYHHKGLSMWTFYSEGNCFKLNPSCLCPGLPLSPSLSFPLSLSLSLSPLFLLSRRVLHSTAQAEWSRLSTALYAAAKADSISLRDFASTTPRSSSVGIPLCRGRIPARDCTPWSWQKWGSPCRRSSDRR